MAALITPNGIQILDSLTITNGRANQLGRWTADGIAHHIANSLVNVVGAEYNYAVTLLQENGLDENNLSADDYPIATQAMLYAIGYQLLKLDLQSSENMPAEPDLGIHRKELNVKMANYYQLAGLEWKKLGITSKYYISPTSGFSETGFASNTTTPYYPTNNNV